MSEQGELAEPYQLGVGEVERLRGDLLQAANLELRGNPYIAHRKKQINALCDAAKAAAMRTPAPSAQEEWRTVPVEPTEEMIDAAGGKYVDLYRADDPGYAPAEVYAAMLAAAPSAPAVAVDFEQLWESVLDIQKEERPNNRDMLANTQGGDLEFFKYMAEQCVNLALRTATPQPGREDAWQPIETAPKDGSAILLGGSDSGVMEGCWMDDPKRNPWEETGWFAADDDVLCDHPRHPSHWQPLPAPPVTASESAREEG